MKLVLYTVFVSVALATQAVAADTPIFPEGEISTTNSHTGTVWLHVLSEPDSVFNYSIAVATFAPGAKLDWHVYPVGQILLITEDIGYYQGKGKPRQTSRYGDIIKCLSGVEHWHGATPDSEVSHLALGANLEKGSMVWLQPVSDKEYSGSK